MSAGDREAEIPDWCKIAERAAQESDPKKLIQLVRALCDRLQQAEEKRNKHPRPEPSVRSNGQSAKPPAA
jgi:hypothetical protein